MNKNKSKKPPKKIKSSHISPSQSKNIRGGSTSSLSSLKMNPPSPFDGF